jgi:archaellum component FlaC
MTLTPEQLQAIKARWADMDSPRENLNDLLYGRSDIPALIAHVERLEKLLEHQRVDSENVSPEFKAFWSDSYTSPTYWQELASLSQKRVIALEQERDNLKSELAAEQERHRKTSEASFSASQALATDMAQLRKELWHKNETANMFMKQVQRLNVELAEAKRDTRRLDWLAKQEQIPTSDYSIVIGMGRCTRAAIDAAMEVTK